MISITGIQGLDYFIMNSDELKTEVIDTWERVNRQLSLEEILDIMKINKSDFTSTDWQDMITYMSRES